MALSAPTRRLIVAGATVAKEDRIRALIPIFERGRWFELETCWRVSRAGVSEDLTRAFIEEEYLAFPVGSVPADGKTDPS